MASQNGHTATVQVLLDGGAQVDIQTKVRYSIELDLSLSFLVYVAVYVLNRWRLPLDYATVLILLRYESFGGD